MKKFFNKIGNAVKKGNAMVNIPLLKEEKKSKEEELRKIKDEYEEKKAIRDSNKSAIQDIDNLIEHNKNNLEHFRVKEFVNKTELLSVIRRTIGDLTIEKQKIEALTDFKDDDYSKKIKDLEEKVSKLQRELTKFRDIVKK
jgi:hypothetical protein